MFTQKKEQLNLIQKGSTFHKLPCIITTIVYTNNYRHKLFVHTITQAKQCPKSNLLYNI
jgi:hypothetical protein